MIANTPTTASIHSGHIEVTTARIAIAMANADSSQNLLRIPDTRISLPLSAG